MGNTGYYGPGSVRKLLAAIENCLDEWEGDPNYGKVAQHLREVQRELDALCLTPGDKAAARAQSSVNSPKPAFNQTGQEPASAKDY